MAVLFRFSCLAEEAAKIGLTVVLLLYTPSTVKDLSVENIMSTHPQPLSVPPSQDETNILRSSHSKSHAAAADSE